MNHTTLGKKWYNSIVENSDIRNNKQQEIIREFFEELKDNIVDDINDVISDSNKNALYFEYELPINYKLSMIKKYFENMQEWFHEEDLVAVLIANRGKNPVLIKVSVPILESLSTSCKIYIDMADTKPTFL